jgi:hypothetical protein
MIHVSAAPLRPRTVGFPESGSDPGMSSCCLPATEEASVLTHIHPSRPRLTCGARPVLHGRGYPGSESGAGQGPPGAQSPFARTRCYLVRRGVSHLVRGHDPSCVAPTSSCARPQPSRRLRLSLLRRVVAGCRQFLPGNGPSRRCLCESVSACLDLGPGASPGAPTRCLPGDIGLHRLGIGSAIALRSGQRLLDGGVCRGYRSFTHGQAGGFARHPGRSYRSGVIHWVAVAGPSEPMTVCSLPVHRIC